MSALSKILRSGEDGAILFWCPGCDGAHQIWIGNGKGPRWNYNGDAERPTFSPSILVSGIYGEPPVTSENYEEWEKNPWVQTEVKRVCHSFVRDGNIEFLSDCTHELRGQTVKIPNFDD